MQDKIQFRIFERMGPIMADPRIFARIAIPDNEGKEMGVGEHLLDQQAAPKDIYKNAREKVVKILDLLLEGSTKGRVQWTEEDQDFRTKVGDGYVYVGHNYAWITNREEVTLFELADPDPVEEDTIDRLYHAARAYARKADDVLKSMMRALQQQVGGF
jgi:hypothetical protein